MKAPVKTPEEMNDVLDSAAPARRLEVEKATETELPSGEVEKAGGQISASRKRALRRFVVTLIIIGIAGVRGAGQAPAPLRWLCRNAESLSRPDRL